MGSDMTGWAAENRSVKGKLFTGTSRYPTPRTSHSGNPSTTSGESIQSRRHRVPNGTTNNKMTEGVDGLDHCTVENSCFCHPWKKTIVPTDVQDHTDADLAAKMNALSFEQRQAMEEDIHGVSGIIEETPDFVKEKIIQLREALDKLNPRQRYAWDRAAFLRPSLSEDKRLYLMCLRARRFRPNDAASLLAAHFGAKLDLFGEDLLLHRITWNDLTEHEQKMFRSGMYQFLPKNDRTGRAVAITRVKHWDLSDFKAMARCVWYTESIVQDDADMQRRGVVTIADWGKWLLPPMQALLFMTTYPMEATPSHDVSLHILYNDPAMDIMVGRLRKVLRNDHRMRIRLHFGSSLETEYALRTFGIDTAGQLSDPEDTESYFVYDGIEESIRNRQQLDDEWNQSEAPYRKPSSPTALFPNPQDIIMGRMNAITATWSGNVVYQQVIERHVDRYIALQSATSRRIDKTLMSLEILHLFRKEYNARFLSRSTGGWIDVDDSEAQKKISQALRMLARNITSWR